MRHSLTRRLAAAAGGVVVAGGLAVVPAGSAHAVDPEAAATETAGWIVDQLTNGLVFNDQFDFDDIGLSADAAFALAEIGGHGATVTQIAAAIEPVAEDEWYTSTFEGVTTEYAGSVAKALVLAQVAGTSPTDFGGVDLVQRLQARVATTAPNDGRIQDVNNAFGDANVIGQSYAVQGLAEADSPLTDSVTGFLLAQQCPAGFFRLNFAPKNAASQSCTPGAVGSEPDTDATALAVLALQNQEVDTQVASAISAATAWLRSVQNADGSFGGGTSTEAPNTNSTGLAAAALAQSSADCAAGRAAGWVLGNRVTDPAVGSKLAAEEGAIAYDAAALTAGRANGITTLTEDQWRRATFQAAPALSLLLDVAPNAKLTGPKGPVMAGTSPKLTLSGLAAGERICFFGPGFPARVVTGTGTSVTFPVPAGNATAKRSYALDKQSSRTVTKFQVLAAQKLKITLKKRVAVGDVQVIKVSKLAPGERVTFRFPSPRSPAVSFGFANAKGVFTVKQKIDNRPGKVKVKAVGELATRKGSAVFRVTR